MASHEQAWNGTRQTPGINRDVSLENLMTWATAATAGSSSWFHIDDQGFATVVSVTTGAKYWAVARPAPGKPKFNSNKVFVDWDPSVVDDRFEWEALLLEPGTVL